MPTIPSGCQFYAANLYVYYYYYSYITDGGLYAGAYQVMHSWSENELTWNIAQPSSTTYISSTRLSTGYMSGARGAYSGSPKTASFDVTTAAASWYANPSSNFGIALKYQSGTNSSVILKSYEAGSEYRAYFVITYTEPQIVNGVYRIKNAQNGMYLDTTGGGVTAGTKIQQWSRASSDTNRNQLFKITFVRTIGSTEQLNYYTIRPMTNNRMGLDSLLGGTAQDVTIEKMSTSDNWDYILYNNLWSISKSGSYYTVKNGRISDMSYMTAPSNTINGAKIFTNDSITDYSKWVLEPYTGEELKGVGWISFASTLIVGEQFSYEAYMYDNRIGINGPISYSVTNTDNSTTDKATIDAMGRIRALKPGTIKIKITYPSSTLIWWWIVTIEESMEGLHFIKNRHYDRYAQVDDNDAPGYANNGGIMEIWPLSGENHQRWNLTHVGNGYYKIASQASGYVITVPAGKETNDNVDLVLKPYTGSNNQKWRITLTSHGSYKIKAKSSESYTSKDLVMDLETNILYNNGLNIRQREYLDNTSYKDEWFLYKTILQSWNSDSNGVGYWTHNPSLYTEKIDLSSTFYFNNGVNSAVNQWKNALCIDFPSGIEDTADIKCYGATKEYFQTFMNVEFDSTTVGLTSWSYYTDGTTTYWGDSCKSIYRMASAKIYILSLGHDDPTQKEIVVHEFGHALGYFGHSQIKNNVMYPYCHSAYTLKPEEIAYLKQFYN